MQFIYTGGTYKEYRGYVFVNFKPTTITDKATETLLLLKKDFRVVEKQEEPEIVGTITLRKAGRPRKVH